MNWVRAIAGVLIFSAAPAWGATLTWTANREPDLAGYRVYQCSQQPCTRTSGNASLLVTLGTTTSFNIGTPAVTQYYFITAYDTANNESAGSNPATYTPAGVPPSVALPIIGASPASLAFVATQGSASPAAQTVNISNQGGGTLTWTVTDDMSWLTLSPVSGTGNGAIILTVNSGTLTAGSYSASIRVNAPGASTVTVPVTLTVATAPVPPAIGASPTNLSFAGTHGGTNPAAKTLSISNAGGGTLSWTVSDDAPWLTLSRVSGTGNGTVTVAANASSLTAGNYTATVTVTAVGASPVTVPVALTVTAASPPPAVPPPTQAAPPTPGGLQILSLQ